MTIQKQALKIAGYELKAIPTGVFGLDGGAMFGTVPKVLWEKTNPPDSQNRIEMEARALLLIGNEKKILIDTGNGSDFVEKYGEKLGTKFSEMYAVKEGKGLLQALKHHQIHPDEITDVILTHLHFDHAGGATKAQGDKIVPTFKDATYFIQKGNIATARAPNIREKASYLSANFEPLLESGKVQILDGDVRNLLPNISVKLSHGHTSHQQMVIVEDPKSGLVYAADVIPTSSHVRSAWIMGYDLDPLLIIKEKRELLSEACKKNWFIYFEHDPYCDFASVVEEKGDFRALERYQLA